MRNAAHLPRLVVCVIVAIASWLSPAMARTADPPRPDIFVFVYDRDLPEVFRPGANGVAKIRDLRFNGIVTDAHFKNPAADLATLDRARAAGVRVAFLLDRYCTCLVDNYHDNDFRALLEKWVSQVRGHPALYGYAICDEPDDSGHARRDNHLRISADLKRLDPRAKTIGVFTDWATLGNPLALGYMNDPNLDVATFSYYLNCDTTTLARYRRDLERFAALNPAKLLGAYAPGFGWQGRCAEPTIANMLPAWAQARAADARYQWLGWWAWRKPEGNGADSPCGAGTPNALPLSTLADSPAMQAAARWVNGVALGEASAPGIFRAR